MAILKIKDENGNITKIPAFKGKSAYDYAKENGYKGTEKELSQELNTKTGIEVTSDKPANKNTVLTVNPDIDKVSIYTSQEIDEMYESNAIDVASILGGVL